MKTGGSKHRPAAPRWLHPTPCCRLWYPARLGAEGSWVPHRIPPNGFFGLTIAAACREDCRVHPYDFTGGFFHAAFPSQVAHGHPKIEHEAMSISIFRYKLLLLVFRCRKSWSDHPFWAKPMAGIFSVYRPNANSSKKPGKTPKHEVTLPLVSREWRNGVQLELLLLPFFHSLLTKGRVRVSLRTSVAQHKFPLRQNTLVQ